MARLGQDKLGWGGCIQMKEVCAEHKNRIERICLEPSCSERALCLLCDHPHGTHFRSIMVKTSQSYLTFQTTINDSIDRYILAQQDAPEHQLQVQQTSLVSSYFADLKAELEAFLGSMESSIMRRLQSEDQDNFRIIKRARIEKNYVNVPKDIYSILLQIYEGVSLEQIFKKNEIGNSEEAHLIAASLHDQLKRLMEERNHRLRVRLPDIRQVLLHEDKGRLHHHETEYDLDAPRPKYEVKLVRESELGFESIISDCQRMQDHFIATSYDKTLRIIDQQFTLRASHEYGNILTRIEMIAEDVFAIAQSKELLIENIQYEEGELRVENVMRLRGHAEKINDLHALNSRIVGSSSPEGVKLWDLYKEKCEYTLKDEANPTVIRFLPSIGALLVGYNNHQLKVYSVETMKLLQKYELPGVPLLLDQGKFPEHQFYVGGFPSALAIIDTRLSKAATLFDLKQGAVTSLADSIYDQNVVATGDREGNCNLFDIRTKKSRISWQAHSFKTNISKPRGIVALFQHSAACWTSVGCNDQSLKLWEVGNMQKAY